jgi:hypothetical protein
LQAQAVTLAGEAHKLIEGNKNKTAKKKLLEAYNLYIQSLIIRPNPGMKEDDFRKLIDYLNRNDLTPSEEAEQDILIMESDALLDKCDTN